MLKIRWKISKRRGNYRPSLILEFGFIESEELLLRPHLVFHKEYPLPGAIHLGMEGAARTGEDSCSLVERIKISLDMFIEKPKTLHPKFILDPDICSSACNTCRAFLEWRPGKADYSDFEAVFRQVAEDLVAAWREAVKEAAASEEINTPEVVITSEGMMPIVEETIEKTRVSRKVKV